MRKTSAESQKVNLCLDCGVPCVRYAQRCRDCWLLRRHSEEDIWRFMEFKPDDANAPSIGYCWEWTKDTSHDYGRITFGRNLRVRVHRVAYQSVYGSIDSSLAVCHKCDNPVCLRPSHLFLGTQSDNNADARQKKRHAYGARHGHAKLREADVRQIRQMGKEGCKGRTLASQFGISPATVCNILKRKIWKHVSL